MLPGYNIALNILWLVVLAYWVWSARAAKQAAAVEPVIRRALMYWLPLAVAMLLLGPGDWYGHSFLREGFVRHTGIAPGIGLAVCMAGAILALWARHVLGSNWSAVVQLKHDHELIERGPYRWIRHPIYTGLLSLFLGNAILVGDWRGLLAVAIVFASFWRKLKLEERWLARHFGESYSRYAARTKALVPGLL